MKTSNFLRITGILLIGMFLTAQANAFNVSKRYEEKKAIVLKVDKPIIEFVAKAYAQQLGSNDIARIHKVLGKIDHVTISFRDEDASDYLLKFEPMNDQDLENWMFDEGYLDSDFETDMEVSVPWMDNMNFASDTETEMEVSVPWMDNMHFASDTEPEMEVPVPWMENMHFAADTETETEVSVPWMENMHLD